MSKRRPTSAAGIPTPISAGSRRWFAVVAVIGVPLILLIAAEASLRFAGLGYHTTFFLERRIEESLAWIDNQDFGKRFFPSGLVRYPHPMAIPAVKPPGTLRIFVLGESAAMGDPDPKFGLPRMLEVLLQERFRNRKIEVVNVSMVAINSHVILPIARECARRDGDLWVIYMGNNEVIGPFGAVTPFGSQAPSRLLIQASLAAKQLRLGQILDGALRRARGSRGAPAEWAGMSMWAEHRVRATDPSIARVHDSFRKNLSGILDAGRQAGIPIILCTVASNLKDCAPFGSLHSPGLDASRQGQWETAYDEGKVLEAQGQPAKALAAYQRAVALDDQFADLSFAIGRCHLALGQTNEAARHFRSARDQDTLQFRADSRINDTVRRFATGPAAAGIHLVDAEELFAKANPTGVPGLEHFYEHVHFTPEGNYLLARAVVERVVEVLGLELGVHEAKSAGLAEAGAQAGPSNAWLEEKPCLEALGFTDWNRYDIVSRMLTERVEQAPFTGQLNHEQHLGALRQQSEQFRAASKPAQLRRAAAQVTTAVARRPDDADLRWNLAHLLDASDNLPQAEEQWRAVMRLLPHAWLPPYNLARLLETHGRTSDARQLYERCLELKPDYFDAQYSLGLMSSKQGQFAEAIPHLERAARLKPLSVAVRLDLGTALQRVNRMAEAERQFNEVLRMEPNNAQAREALGQIRN